MNRIYPFLLQSILFFCLAAAALVSSSYFFNVNFFQKTEEPLITLTGKLRLRLFPGPPEYSSIEEGDRADHCWIVELDDPSFLLALNVPDNELSLDLCDILMRKDAYILMLCLNDGHVSLCQQYKDQNVAVRGNLFHAHTAHHYTPMLLDLKQLVKATTGNKDNKSAVTNYATSRN